MAFRIALIGLNWRNISCGLAIQAHDPTIKITGWAPDIERLPAANKKSGLKKITRKMRDAVRQANLIFLGVDMIEKEKILRELAAIKPLGSLVVNSTPLFGQTIQLMQKFLGNRITMLSIYPVVQPKYLQMENTDLLSGQTDVFKNSHIFFADPGNSSPAVLDLAVDIAVLFGGKPVFTTPEELDGFLSSADLFPKLMAAEMIQAAFNQPGWAERKNVHSNAFFQPNLILDGISSSENLAKMVTANKMTLIANLDLILQQIVDLRKMISNEDAEKIEERIRQAYNQRLDWLNGQEKWPVEGLVQSLPSPKEALKHLQSLDY